MVYLTTEIEKLPIGFVKRLSPTTDINIEQPVAPKCWSKRSRIDIVKLPRKVNVVTIASNRNV